MAAGAAHNVNPFLLAAQAKRESMGFAKSVIECRLNSPVGARGISQFMPGTAKKWGVNPCDVNSAIDGQARYMEAILKRFNNREDLALAAYNSGVARMDKLWRVPNIKETQDYIQAVWRYKAEMEAGQ